MLFFTSKYNHQVVNIIIILQAASYITKVETMNAAKTLRRTQYQHLHGAPTYNVELTRPASLSSLSTSSSIKSSASRNIELESEPSASTSGILREKELQTFIEGKSKQVSFSDPLSATHSEHLDPRRDGVFARLRNRALRYGSAAVVGSAIGVVGGLSINQHLFQNNTMRQTNNLTNTTEIVSDDISDPI